MMARQTTVPAWRAALAWALSLALALSGLSALAAAPRAAYASVPDQPQVGDSFECTAVVQNRWWNEEEQTYDKDYRWCEEVGDSRVWFDLYFPELGASGYAFCMSPGTTYAPSHDMSVICGLTVTGVDMATGTVTASVGWDRYRNGWDDDWQHGGCGQVVFHRDYTGSIVLHKASALPAISDGNACYDLAGAVYGVYRNAECTDLAAEMVTDSSGNASAGGLAPGTYWVRETGAATGYAVDMEAHEVAVAAGATSDVNVTDKPKGDPAYVAVGKIDAATGEPVAVGDGSLAGAEFSVEYYDGYYGSPEEARASGDPERAWVISTKENGYADLSPERIVSGSELYYNEAGIPVLPLGTYVVQETKAPAGYELKGADGAPPAAQSRQVTNDDTPDEAVHTYNVPVIEDIAKLGGIVIGKADAEKYSTPDGEYYDYAQGDATFAGAAFDVVNRSAAPTWADLNHNKRKDDGEMIAVGDKVMTIETAWNESLGAYTATTGEETLSFGTYEIVESRAPEGYTGRGITSRTVKIEEDKQMKQLVEADGILNEVARGGVQVTKQDAELSKSEAIGGAGHAPSAHGATLEGIQFTVVNRSAHGVMVGNEYKAAGDTVAVIETAWNADKGAYTAQTASDALPYGTYEVTETATNGSYLLTDGSARTFEVRADGTTVTSDTRGTALTFKDNVARNDLKLVKKTADGGKLAGVPFLITNETTGEAHVAVTDRNGQLATSSGWRSHKANTNANDVLIGKEGIKTSDVVEGAGVWFGLGEDGSMAAADDSLAALPYGLYTIEEMRCEANEGYRLWSDEFEVTRDISATTYEIDLGTVIDQREAKLATTAIDKADGDHQVTAAGNAVIVDRVEYAELEPGKAYVMTGTLMDKSTGKPFVDASGETVTATKEFTPISPYGTVELEFAFDARGMEGMSTVVFEKLTYADGGAVGSHEDIDDEGQTVGITKPAKIGTTAADARSGSHEGQARAKMQIVDKVAYEGLLAGTEYTIHGTLMDADTGQAALDASGRAIEAETTFTAPTSEGEVSLTFTFDGSELAGHRLVAFEQLLTDGREAAKHADIDDMGQTVDVIDIGTKASDTATGDSMAMAGKSAFADTVSYQNLKAGAEYRLVTVLADPETGSAVTDAAGNQVQAETTFAPDGANGEKTVTVSLDASNLAGTKTVFFEYLYDADGNCVASHADASDEGQSIHIPGIGTTAADTFDGDKQAVADEKTSITDTVAYKGLIAGREYTLTGTLMDKETGKEFADANGRAVTASAKFTPQTAEGETDIVFEFDATGLGGKSAVAFETLTYSGREVAVHADIDDEAQTVGLVVPSIKTTAVDSTDGDHVMYASKTARIVDTVEYIDIRVADGYTMKGTLMDKKTGKAVQSGKGDVTAETKFSATAEDGTVEVAFEFDASALAGRDLVVFEKLLDAEGNQVATHEDIDDAAQTVSVAEIPAEKAAANRTWYDKTGASVVLGAIAAAMLAAAGVAFAASRAMRKRENDDQ